MSSSIELAPAHLEWQQRRDAISAMYARFYAPIALAVTVIAFVPLFHDRVTLDSGVEFTESYDSLVGMAGQASGPAAFALILMPALVGLLFAACFRARDALLPLCIAGLAAVLLAMLLGQPGMGSERAGYTAAGVAGIVIGFWTLLLGVVHAVHLHPLGSPVDRPPPPDDPDELEDGFDDEVDHDGVSESDRPR